MGDPVRSFAATPVLAHAVFRVGSDGPVDRRGGIDVIDVNRALAQPARNERQSDGRLRYWYWVAERQRWLHVVTEADGGRARQTVYNAFWDRTFEP